MYAYIDGQTEGKFDTISNRYSYHRWPLFAVKSRNSFRFLSTLLVISLLAACKTQLPPEEPPAVEPEPVKVAMNPAQLNIWLEAAEAAIDRDELTYPEQDSAYAVYQRILAVDPEQEDALRGLERIVEIFVDRAMRALERRQFASARSMLTRAKLILPDHPSIEPSAEQIRLIMSAERDLMKLSQPDLNAATAALQSLLQQFADTGERNCRFVINAKNDEQGRWIYQTMSKGVSDGRLRAQLNVRLPASVERLCFAA